MKRFQGPNPDRWVYGAFKMLKLVENRRGKVWRPPRKEVPLLALSELTVIKCIDDKGLWEHTPIWLKQFQTQTKERKRTRDNFQPVKGRSEQYWI